MTYLDDEFDFDPLDDDGPDPDEWDDCERCSDCGRMVDVADIAGGVRGAYVCVSCTVRIWHVECRSCGAEYDHQVDAAPRVCGACGAADIGLRVGPMGVAR